MICVCFTRQSNTLAWVECKRSCQDLFTHQSVRPPLSFPKKPALPEDIMQLRTIRIKVPNPNGKPYPPEFGGP